MQLLIQKQKLLQILQALSIHNRKKKTLPKTGQEKQSYLAFFGVAILGLVGSLLKKKQI
nr:LPXTG cell wall anchor domain-containing protein [Streptococcus agalactiae]